MSSESSEIVIKVSNLSKRYRIGSRRAANPLMLREVLGSALAKPFRLLQRLRQSSSAGDHIWALRDVSFEVPRGQILGIMGPNGAGKSTLLKILSRITEPSEGRAELQGKVASLLEVGTGFHPELTGRENIYMSGALLGMRKPEVDRNLDQIIAFSEIEKFIETPVKRYSTGMYVRLAFSVAAHLTPEILILDEVLAVGDAAFQRKCLNRMEEVRRQGRTILFVSHSVQAVSRICDRAILISDGRIREDGPATEIAGSYLRSMNARATGSRSWEDPETAPGNGVVRLRSVRVIDESGSTIASTDVGRRVGIEMVYEVLEEGHTLVSAYHFFNEAGECVFATQDLDPAWRGRARPRGKFRSVAWIPGNYLTEGALSVGLGIATYQPAMRIHVHQQDVVTLRVNDTGKPDAARGDYDGPLPGVIRPLLAWDTVFHPGS